MLIVASALWILTGPPSSAAEVPPFVLAPCDIVTDQGWDLARDAARLEREFQYDRISIVQDAARGRVLQWEFRIRDGQPLFSDLFLRRGWEEGASALALWLRNDGPELQFAVKVGERDGSEWTIEPRPLAAHSGWQQLELPLAEFHVASWSSDENAVLDYPVSYLALIAFGVKAETDYRLLVDQVEVLYPPRPAVRVSDVVAPQQARAGSRVDVALALTPEEAVPAGAPAWTVLRHDVGEVAQWPVELPALAAGQPTRIGPFDAELPPYMLGGTCRLELRMPGYLVQYTRGEVLAEMDVQARKPGRCIAEIHEHNGAPTLFINGKPNAAQVYMTYNPTSRYFEQFGKAGVHLYSFPSTCSRHTWQGMARPVWTEPGDHFDFGQVDEQILRILAADPEAYIFPRVYINSPTWWDEQHPDDLVRYDDGTGETKLFLEVDNKPCPTWTSEAFRRDMGYALGRYIEHVRSQPYADRVIGYHVASGTTEEWMYWGANEGKFCDYSPANLRAFRAWLRARYRSNEALQVAWGQPGLTLATAEIPPYTKRVATEHGVLRDPVTARDVIDFHLFTSDTTAQTIGHFARVVKQATDGDSLFGAFYGYVLQLIAEQRQQNAGHLALREVWDNPDVDFLTSPTSYMFRQLGTGYSHFMSLTDSVSLHGKLWFDENDIRTWQTPGNVGDWGKTETREATILLEQREVANVLAHACGMWWFDMGGAWYDDPVMMQAIEQMDTVADATPALDRSPVDEIAVIVDDQSLAYLQTGARVTAYTLAQMLPELGRIGAPVGYYALDDLDQLPDRKLYVFLDCIAPTVEQRRLIEERVKRNGHIAVWLYATGLVRDGKLDVEAMSDLTGIRVRMQDQPAAVRARRAAVDDPLLAGIAPDAEWGWGEPIGPTFVADDPAATVLAEAPGVGPAMAIRRLGDWTSIWSATAPLPTALLRNAAREAGVQLYVEQDATAYANRSLLALHVNDAGDYEVRLPRRATVTDLWTGQEVAREVEAFTAHLPALATGLWRVD